MGNSYAVLFPTIYGCLLATPKNFPSSNVEAPLHHVPGSCFCSVVYMNLQLLPFNFYAVDDVSKYFRSFNEACSAICYS